MILKFGVPAIALLIMACNTKSQRVEDAIVDVKEDAAVNCYRYSKDKDTINLKITRNGDSITGSLVYNLHEKDKNSGTVQGRIMNDVLIAEYTFMSEGVTSVRQVAFKKEEDAFIEGFGDVSVDNNNRRATFKNTDSLTYTNGLKLKGIECTE